MANRHEKHAEVAELRAELRQLAATLERAAKSESAAALEASTDTVRDLLGRANSLIEALADTDRVRDLALAGRDRLGKTIKTDPFLAIGIAALTGFLMGCLRPRR